MSIQIKAVEQYFVVRRTVFMWYKVVLAFALVGIILQCAQGLEGYSRDPGFDQNTVQDSGKRKIS